MCGTQIRNVHQLKSACVCDDNEDPPPSQTAWAVSKAVVHMDRGLITARFQGKFPYRGNWVFLLSGKPGIFTVERRMDRQAEMRTNLSCSSRRLWTKWFSNRDNKFSVLSFISCSCLWFSWRLRGMWLLMLLLLLLTQPALTCSSFHSAIHEKQLGSGYPASRYFWYMLSQRLHIEIIQDCDLSTVFFSMIKARSKHYVIFVSCHVQQSLNS